jgi:sugar-specific transcriptional regulator TrmB
MAIHDTLKKLGLNDKEVKLYLAIQRNGKIKPAKLAELTKINRATVYNLAGTLLSKGLIAEDISGKTLYFAPLPPASLETILEENKRELKEKESLVKKAVGELSLLTTSKEYSVPKIRFVEEGDLKKYLFDNLTKWQDAVIDSDGIWWGYQDHTFVENFESWIKASWETGQSKHHHYKSQIFTNESKIEQKIKGRYPADKRGVRFLQKTGFTATMWVCGDYLVTIVTNVHPFHLIEIHDPMIAHNTKEVFKKLWEK